VAAICMFVFQPFPTPTGGVDLKSLPPPKQGFWPMLTIFLLALSGISSFMWTLVDLVDRKLRLVWIVPLIACCACGLQAIPHALYMLMRKSYAA
jgi:hypothetical protein